MASRTLRLTPLWRQWVLRFTLGELLGFGLVPVLGGMLLWAATGHLEASARAGLIYGVAIVGGLFEGATLATFQWRLVACVVPEISRAKWIVHTAIAASVAWAAGMLAPTLDDMYQLSTAVMVAIWVPASIIILLSIGYAQQRLLRPHVRRAWRWLVANIVGWLLGLPWTFVLPALLPPGTPTWGFAIAFGIGGTLMGATAGAVTGMALLRFQSEARPAARPSEA